MCVCVCVWVCWIDISKKHFLRTRGCSKGLQKRQKESLLCLLSLSVISGLESLNKQSFHGPAMGRWQ